MSDGPDMLRAFAPEFATLGRGIVKESSEYSSHAQKPCILSFIVAKRKTVRPQLHCGH